MIAGLVGILGVVVGIGVTEWFRRRSRVEDYAREVFSKRLSIYEGLFKKMQNSVTVAGELFDNRDLNPEQRHAIWSEVVMDVAEYTDANALYLNDEVTVHCMLTLISVDDAASVDDETERDRLFRKYGSDIKKAKELIREASGMNQIEQTFADITQPWISGAYVEAFRRLEALYPAGVKRKPQEVRETARELLSDDQS